MLQLCLIAFVLLWIEHFPSSVCWIHQSGLSSDRTLTLTWLQKWRLTFRTPEKRVEATAQMFLWPLGSTWSNTCSLQSSWLWCHALIWGSSPASTSNIDPKVINPDESRLFWASLPEWWEASIWTGKTQMGAAVLIVILELVWNHLSLWLWPQKLGLSCNGGLTEPGLGPGTGQRALEQRCVWKHPPAAKLHHGCSVGGMTHSRNSSAPRGVQAQTVLHAEALMRSWSCRNLPDH